MSIRYITSGDEFAARSLLGEGRHQLSILKRLMAFQGLKQLQRITRFEDGTIIKCLSCFAQDVIEVFVPLAPIGEAPKYEVTTRSNYWPAITAYAGPNYDDEFLGVVLCKGGGFNSPYEFVSKDSLPKDWFDRQNEELFSERFWESFDGDRVGGKYGGTSYQDIVPSGITRAKLIEKTATQVDYSLTKDSFTIIKKIDREWWEGAPLYCDCWYYEGRVGANFSYTRTQRLREDYGFCYWLPGDPSLGNWPDYEYEGVLRAGGDKSGGRDLKLSAEIYYNEYGEGSNNFISNQFDLVSCYAMKFVVDGVLFGIPFGHWEPDDTDCNFATIEADAIAQVDYDAIAAKEATYTIDGAFGEARGFIRGQGEYEVNKTSKAIHEFRGSVLDDDHYALLYGLDATSRVNTWLANRPSDQSKCLQLPMNPPEEACVSAIDYNSNKTFMFGPINVVVDGVIFEVAGESLDSMLQHLQVKYFKLSDELSIGMFCVAKNYTEPYDNMYVYVKVDHKDGNHEFITTPVDAHNHLIPGVTGPDDVDLYGHWNFRLILETITTIKKVA